MAAIKSMMKRDLVTARPDDTVASVARSMRVAGVGAVLVMDGGELRGVFTERDAVNRVLAAGLDPATTRVGEVSSDTVISVGPETSVRECAELLTKHRIRHLPVLDEGKPVGIVSARDFFVRVAAGLEQWIGQRSYERGIAEGDDPYDHIGGSYGR